MKTPPNPAATNLFKKYVANSPEGTFPAETSTYQGLYCLTADGDYLSGRFARQSNEAARDALTGGLKSWQRIVSDRGYRPKSVPTNRLALYGGEDLRKGGLKLEVAYRDFPRGEVKRPGNAQFPNPYNLGWFDLTPAEVKSLVSNSKEKTAVPDQIFQKLARTRLKDAVRGQMGDWEKGDLKSGQLFTQLVSSKGSEQVYELSGSALIGTGARNFSPGFHGSMTFDTASGEFTDFRLIAAGQRSGKGPANGRATDLGPAPMAITLTLYRP
ncbi:MAG: hypothetical protein QNL33_09245 [Akkermansiaceae bacterium]